MIVKYHSLKPKELYNKILEAIPYIHLRNSFRDNVLSCLDLNIRPTKDLSAVKKVIEELSSLAKLCGVTVTYDIEEVL